MGELLTVSVLGGACFGLPTTMVSERERGVWRRYRLAPVSTRRSSRARSPRATAFWSPPDSLQLALALALGMPCRQHPLDLFVAFTFVSFAFIGLGLVMAMMADNVPAVQALGQCIFLPMLIIGGIAVPLASLPDWAQHLSAFFPGRYAVEALQACVNPAGLRAVRFDLLALTIIGAGGCVAGAKMFRWDAQQRFAMRRTKRLAARCRSAAWAAVGVLSEVSHRVGATPRTTTTFARARRRQDASTGAGASRSSCARRAACAVNRGTPRVQEPQPATPETDRVARKHRPRRQARRSLCRMPARGRNQRRRLAHGLHRPRAQTPAAPGQTQRRGKCRRGLTGLCTEAQQLIAPTWQAVSRADIDRDLVFDRLPSDGGIVAPIAPADEDPPPEVLQQLDAIVTALPKWGPAHVQDPVQRARNILYIAAVPDVWQTELERYAPAVIFDQLEQDIPKDDLIKVLYWIALHPMDGDDTAIDQLPALGFESRAVDIEQARERVALYAVKLLGRLVGAIKSS